MAGHSHDDHHLTEQKPVSFTVPFILAAVTILIIVLFLSLCDPKAHHAGAHDGQHHENAAHEQFQGEVHNPNAPENSGEIKGDHATSTTQDEHGQPAAETATATETAPAKEEAHGAEHH
jgi:hypothetical protein